MRDYVLLRHISYVCIFFFLMIRRPPRSTLSSSSAASDVYKRQDSLLVQIKAKVDSVAGPSGDTYQNKLTIRKIVAQHMFISGSPSAGRGGHNGDSSHHQNLIPRARGGWGDTTQGTTRTLQPEDRLRLSGPSDTSDPTNSLDLQQLRRVLERGFGITQASEEDYQALFDRFDLNEDGILSVNELCWGLVFGCTSADGRSSNVGRRLGVTGINQVTNPGARDAILRVKKLSLIHISEPTRLLSISYAVFCLKKKNKTNSLQSILNKY
eukprot:TRINITY_DN63667_c0_g1_i1.p1 TRINITY_DN63667_c0_g1~~TRINITY_DN63667_c0_g1_i1.p1  ORF type:complete len:267 (-),score=64.75 TRINITY_DN63667_c0_g1_i1:33-833(-)